MAKKYELLTTRLMELITARSPLVTTRLEHDVRLLGRSGNWNRIDVIWEFLTPDGTPRRVIIECRRRGRPIENGALHQWRGVVDDVTTPEMPTIGVMATLTGYQQGAKNVANTYGVVILQLREPTEVDLASRLTEVTLQLSVRELGDISEPVIAPHPVTHTFTPPVVLALSGTPLARISSVSATLGEVELPQDHIVLDGRALAWMIANVLDSTRLWFTDTDLHVTTDTDTEPVVTDVVLGRPKTKPGS